MFRKLAIFSSTSIGCMYLTTRLIYPESAEGVISLMNASFRISKIFWNGVKIIYNYKADDPLDWSKSHIINSKILSEVLEQNGGIFIKLGQYIANMDLIMPKIYVETLQPLLNKCPVSDYNSILFSIENNFKECYYILNKIETIPLASGSLAQVHCANLTKIYQDKYNMTKVVVKVQHPFVKKMSAGDINLIKFATYTLEKLFNDFRIEWLGKTFQKFTPYELDFKNEYDNMKRISNIFIDNTLVYVPKTIDELCSSSIITMEYVEGVFLDDVEGLVKMGLNPKEVINSLNEIFYEMIFIHGTIHADPHARNILVRKHPDPSSHHKFQIVLLDHGLYSHISEEMIYHYAKLWQAYLTKNIPAIKHHSAFVNIYDGVDGDYFADWKFFASMNTMKEWPWFLGQHAKEEALGGSKDVDPEMLRKNFKRFALKISRICSNLPSEVLLIFKVNDFLRALNLKLGQNFNNFAVGLMRLNGMVYKHEQKRGVLDWWNYWVMQILLVFKMIDDIRMSLFGILRI